MRELAKSEEIVIRIKSADPTLPERAFIAELGTDKVVFRKMGGKGYRYPISWKAILSTAMIHSENDDL